MAGLEVRRLKVFFRSPFFFFFFFFKKIFFFSFFRACFLRRLGKGKERQEGKEEDR